MLTFPSATTPENITVLRDAIVAHNRTKILDTLAYGGSWKNAGKAPLGVKPTPFDGALLTEVLTEAICEGMGDLWPAFVEAGADFSDSYRTGSLVCSALRHRDGIKPLKAMTEADLIRPDLTVAAICNSGVWTKWLISRGAPLETRDPESGRTPLFEAIVPYAPRRYRAWEALLAADANSRHRDAEGVTPLHLCARLRKPTLIRQLVKLGADIHSRSDEGLTPLLEVFTLHRLNYESSLRINLTAKYHNRSRQTQLALRLLLAAGANPRDVDADGNTGLHSAVRVGERALIRSLLALGFDPHQRNHAGETALEIAIRHNNGDAYSVLEKVSPPLPPGWEKKIDWDNIPPCDGLAPVLSRLRRSPSFWEKFIARINLTTPQLDELRRNPTIPSRLMGLVDSALA